MRMWRFVGLFTVALLSYTSQAGVAAPPSAPAAAPPPPQNTPGGSVFSDVKRIVAIGDLHGDFEKFTAVLHLCQLSRNEGGQERWIGGATHLVQTGDVLDRGPDSK